MKLLYNYQDRFKVKDRVLFDNKKATIVHIHSDGLMNLEVDNECGYVFGIHAPSSLILIKKNN